MYTNTKIVVFVERKHAVWGSIDSWLMRKKSSVVLVAAFDRIARSTRNCLQVIDELDSMGIEFIAGRENVDTSGPMGPEKVTRGGSGDRGSMLIAGKSSTTAARGCP